MSERLSRGLRKHIRRELGEARKSVDPRKLKTVEDEASKLRLPTPKVDRLVEIAQLLGDNGRSPVEKAELKIESLWIRFKRGDIGEKERRTNQEGILDNLETTHPDYYDLLMRTVKYDERGGPISRIAEIRDRVLKG